MPPTSCSWKSTSGSWPAGSSRGAFKSPPGRALAATSVACVIVGATIPFTPAAGVFGFRPLPSGFFAILAAMVVTDLALVELGKALFFARWGPAASGRPLTERRRRPISRVRTRWRAALSRHSPQPSR